MVFEKLSGF